MATLSVTLHKVSSLQGGSLDPSNPLVYEITQYAYNTISNSVEVTTYFSNQNEDFELGTGDFVHSYCVGSTRHVITYDGNDDVIDTTEANSTRCCEDFSFTYSEQSGTTAGTRKLVFTIFGDDSPFMINVNFGGFAAVSNPPNQHVIDNIPAGTTGYNISVNDNKGCIASDNSIVVNNNAACDGFDFSVSQYNASFGNSDGQVTASAFGGSSPYTYQLDGGTGQASGVFAGQSPGDKVVLVTDSNGCQKTKNITVGENPDTPSGMFDPELLISPAIPYRFSILKADPLENVFDNKLYGEDKKYNTGSEGFCQSLDNNGIFTFQCYYKDESFGSHPQLRIYDYATDAQLYDLNINKSGDGTSSYSDTGFYQRSVNWSTTGISNRIVYIQLWSRIGSTHQFAHATSEPIRVSDLDRTKVIEFIYTNSKNIITKHGLDKPIDYETNGYENRLNIPILDFWKTSPQTESVIEDIGEGNDSKVYEQTKEQRVLTTRQLPDYMHKKIKLVSSHDNIKVNDGNEISNYVFTGEAEPEEYIYKSRKRRVAYNLVNQEFNNENIIT